MSNTQAIGVAYADPALNSFEVGTSSAPIAVSASGNLNQIYARTTHASGDMRGLYARVNFAGGFRFASFFALYAARPLAVIPAPCSVER